MKVIMRMMKKMMKGQCRRRRKKRKRRRSLLLIPTVNPQSYSPTDPQKVCEQTKLQHAAVEGFEMQHDLLAESIVCAPLSKVLVFYV